MRRRQFLQMTIAAPIVAARRGSGATLVDRGFARVTQIADGVFATIAEPRRGLQCYSNGGVIAGHNAVLIIEGHFQPEGAALEIEIARTVSRAPIRGVVDTHYHLDHTFGNAGYALQQIPVLAHYETERLMRSSYARLSEEARAAWLGPWEKRVAAARDQTNRARAAGDLEQMRWMGNAVDHAALAFPSEPLGPGDLPKTIDLGGLGVLIDARPGHSPTDLLIRVPDRGVVFTGDLFFNQAYPVVADANVLAWRRVLDELEAFDKGTQFIPGHGPIGSLNEIREHAAIMDDLRDHAERMMRAGVPADEAEIRYAVPRRFRRFEMLCWAFTVGGAMRNYYAALRSARA
jgi:glyoxylase-like metal-dependent hydrolase (beta-lactamase superfamily II)